MENRLKEKRRGEAGFTMVELIIVMVVLGVLAATLLPTYMDVGGQASASVTVKMHGDIRSTLHSVHGMHLAQQASGAALNPALVATCPLALALLDENGGVACAGDNMVFPDGRQVAFTAEAMGPPATPATIANLPP